MINFEKTVLHPKTGNIYIVLNERIINATNGINDQQIMILYANLNGEIFVRESNEFWSKFYPIDKSDIKYIDRRKQ